MTTSWTPVGSVRENDKAEAGSLLDVMWFRLYRPCLQFRRELQPPIRCQVSLRSLEEVYIRKAPDDLCPIRVDPGTKFTARPEIRSDLTGH